jgi:hypothetical protein
MNTVKLTLRDLEKIFWCHKIITPAALIQFWLLYHFECSGNTVACTATDVAGGSVQVNVGIEYSAYHDHLLPDPSQHFTCDNPGVSFDTLLSMVVVRHHYRYIRLSILRIECDGLLKCKLL